MLRKTIDLVVEKSIVAFVFTDSIIVISGVAFLMACALGFERVADCLNNIFLLWMLIASIELFLTNLFLFAVVLIRLIKTMSK